jgi:hypothetical protein
MPFLEILTSSGFASLLGMRHALEPDHVAAVTTLVSREQSSYRAAWLGVCWGIGHTLTLFVVGLGVVLVRKEIPAGLADVCEINVATMLIALGLRSVLQAVQLGSKGPSHLHSHQPIIHQHLGAPAHVHIGHWTFARRPLIVGMVHGLAGGGTLAALVLTTLPTTTSRLAYMILFGLGSTAGMAALSGLLGWPLARLGTHQRATRGISFVVGGMSMALGIIWGYPLIARLTVAVRP